MAQLGVILHGGPVGDDEIARVRETVVYEPPNLKVKLVKFYILIGLAAAISTYGLLADSVATVIGAMIVAPLMMPIMGAAFGMSIGDSRAIRNSVFFGWSGALLAVFIGWLLSFWMPGAFDVTNIGQVMSRTAPRLIDLLAALATGLAGAFAIGREDVGDTLPGVAVAIALVPPLANVGILVGQSEWDLALGSLTLFLTNYFAIVLTGALVFSVFGFPRARLLSHETRRSMRIALVVVVISLGVISIPLSYHSWSIILTARNEAAARITTERWLEGTEYRFIEAVYDDQNLNIVIEGNGRLPDEELLIEELAADEVVAGTVRVDALVTRRLDFSLD